MEQSRLNAENAMQTKSLFLSNMSHEIRTPLSALSGFSSLLTEQALDEETRRQCGDIIQQNSDLLLKLINDVIDLSNLEIGNMKFNFNYYDAIAICNNVIDTVNKVKQTQAELRFHTSLTSLKLYTDDSRLQQLLINLLINATKFTPQGSITLEVRQESEDFALFSVTDTGCGIPLEKQSSIFNRFEKLNEGAQGTGLGLSICQLIIERIGGKIWIDSTYTDGCRFYFTHPIQSHEQRKGDTGMKRLLTLFILAALAGAPQNLCLQNRDRKDSLLQVAGYLTRQRIPFATLYSLAYLDPMSPPVHTTWENCWMRRSTE